MTSIVHALITCSAPHIYIMVRDGTLALAGGRPMYVMSYAWEMHLLRKAFVLLIKYMNAQENQILY